MKIRLRQFLSKSGFFKNKKEAEDAIRLGFITLSGGEIMKSPSYQFNPKKKNVYFKGKLIKPFRKHVYIIMNKPSGYLSASKLSEEELRYGKKSVFELIKDIDEKLKRTLFCIGRLDEDTTGLLIITNDGELSNTITNPENNILKRYKAKLERALTPKSIEEMEQGVTIKLEEEGRIINYKTKPCKITVNPNNPLEITITVSEGKKREIKRIFESVFNKVLDLSRISVGGLKLEDLNLKLGEYKLVDKEYIINNLRKNSV